MCKLPLSVSHAYVYQSLICQCSRFLKGNTYKQEEGWRWDQENNEREKRGSFQLVERKFMHIWNVQIITILPKH